MMTQRTAGGVVADASGPEGLSIAEAARFIGVSARKMTKLISEGRVASLKIDRRRIVRRSALVAFLDSLEQGGEG